MKVVQINITCGQGSTGKICVNISNLLADNNVENYILYSSGTSPFPCGIRYMNRVEIKIEALRSHIYGNYGFNTKIATRRLIRKLKEISPDIIHLHNLHGHNIHLGVLFTYLKTTNIKIFWTFHDCWAFTAYCPYYDLSCCNQWQSTCTKCPQRKKYSWFFDRSADLFLKKKDLLKNQDLTIITPSQWLANETKKSFLKDLDIKVINNGIDLTLFHPTNSDIRNKYQLGNKFVILGVAFDWSERKGLHIFTKLANVLSDEYQIILVGITDKQRQQLPSNIITIHRTMNQTELAEIYSAADVFVNPTYEENFPTVNLESLACGTPVITFNTGGSAEMLTKKCGIVIQKNDFDGLYNSVLTLKKSNLSSEDCRLQAEKYRDSEKYKQYIDLYMNGYE